MLFWVSGAVADRACSKEFQDTVRRAVTSALLFLHLREHDLCAVDLCEERVSGVSDQERRVAGWECPDGVP